MPSRNEQDYLRVIYELQLKSGGSVRSGAIAGELGISKPSVSEMVAKLKRAGLAESKSYGAVSLSEKGIAEARRVLRKHRLLEVFFANLLGIKNAFHREAHEIEHSISEEAAARLEKLLGHPRKCPDGDEIPPREGRVLQLGSAPLGMPLKILFSRLGKKEELARVKALGIIHGERARVLKRVSGGPIVLLVKGSEVALSREIASRIYAEAA